MSEKDREQPELKTIKVSEDVHSDLLQAKIKLKAKTISLTIRKLLEKFEK